MSMQLYYDGRLSEAVAGLMMPVQCIEAQANAVFRCAKDASLAAPISDEVEREIVRLEQAVETLREAASLAKRKAPVLRLVAAE
jgi:hypothetical protein